MKTTLQILKSIIEDQEKVNKNFVLMQIDYLMFDEKSDIIIAHKKGILNSFDYHSTSYERAGFYAEQYYNKTFGDK